MKRQRDRFSLLVVTSIFAALGSSSCADLPPEGEADAPDREAAAPTALQVDDGEIDIVPPPRNITFSKDAIRVEGTGCPTATPRLSASGDAFQVIFSQYKVMVNSATNLTDSKECVITVPIDSPDGFSFAVTRLTYRGRVDLTAPGMIAKMSASYSFLGTGGISAAPTNTIETFARIIGPAEDAAFILEDNIRSEDLQKTTTWSPCGTRRDLTIRTSAYVKNVEPRGEGWLSVTSLDGETPEVGVIVSSTGVRTGAGVDITGSMAWKPGPPIDMELAWRRCNPPGTN